MKLAWHVPRGTHTYFIDHLLSSGLSSVRTDILSRYRKFVAGLLSSPSMEVRVMCRVAAGDVRTTTGRNLWYLRRETGLNPLKISSVKLREALACQVSTVPEVDRWRVSYLAKLLEARGQAYYEGSDVQDWTALIDSLCTN